MDTILDSQVGLVGIRNLELVASAENEARITGIDGVEAWRLPDGTVVAFTTPSVPFGKVHWVEKTWTATIPVAA